MGERERVVGVQSDRPALLSAEKIDLDAPLFAEDIAKLHRVSVREAQRLLLRWEEEYGSDAVQRRPARFGVRRFTTRAALRRAFGLARESLLEVLERVHIVEDEQRAQGRELATLRDRVAKLR